jgi:AhpD family alkylhydroperoxidase
MMLDWSQYREQLLKAIGDIGRLSPQTMRGHRELSDAGTKTARLDPKTREVIALAVGVTRQCDGCITTHVHSGASTERRQKRSPKHWQWRLQSVLAQLLSTRLV